MITDVISLIFISCGAFFVFSAAVGLVRFPDALSRIHVITKPQTVGILLTVTGAIIRVLGSPHFTVAERGDLGILVLLILFTLITSPVTSQRLGRVTRREGLYGDEEHMSLNENPAPRASRREKKRRAALIEEAANRVAQRKQDQQH